MDQQIMVITRLTSGYVLGCADGNTIACTDEKQLANAVRKLADTIEVPPIPQPSEPSLNQVPRPAIFDHSHPEVVDDEEDIDVDAILPAEPSQAEFANLDKLCRAFAAGQIDRPSWIRQLIDWCPNVDARYAEYRLGEVITELRTAGGS